MKKREELHARRRGASKPLAANALLFILSAAGTAVSLSSVGLGISLLSAVMVAFAILVKPTAATRAIVWPTLLMLAVLLVIGLLHSPAIIATWYWAIYIVSISATAIVVVHMGEIELPSIKVAASGIAVGMVLGTVILPSSVAGLDWIKSGPGLGIALLTFALLARPHLSRMLALAVGLVLSAVFLLSGFRSEALIVATCALLVAAFYGKARKPRKRDYAKVVAVALVAGGLFSMAYGTAAERGTLGTAMKEKYDRQREASGGVLFAARPELYVSKVAVEAHPLVGRGGSPRMTPDERSSAIGQMTSDGLRPTPNELRRLMGTTVNSHSIIFSIWVQTGVLMFLGWVVVLLIIVSTSVGALLRGDLLSPLATLLSIQLCWDLLFSPWNPNMELVIGLAIGIAILNSWQTQADRMIRDNRGTGFPSVNRRKDVPAVS